MLKKLPYYLVPLNVFVDISLFYFERGGVLSTARGVLMLLFIIIVALRYKKNTKYYGALVFFACYVMFTVLFSTDVFLSAKNSLKILVSMLSFIVGFNLVNTLPKLERLSKSLIYVYILLILNYIVSNIFKLGTSVYTGSDDFLTGNLTDNWNLFTYSVLVCPLMLAFGTKKTWHTYAIMLLAFVCSILVIISLKRNAIAGIVLGFSIYGILKYKMSAMVKYGMLLLLLVTVSLPLYKDLLLNRLEARSNRFEEGSIEREARYLESIYVWEETLSFENPVKSFFGMEGFNSVGNYAGGSFGFRQLHVDYNNIVNTIGLVGLFCYFFLFARMFLLFRKLKTAFMMHKDMYRQLKATFFVLFLCPFMTSFAGQMYAVSFRLIIFIFLGSILGVFLTHRKLMLRYARHESTVSL